MITVTASESMRIHLPFPSPVSSTSTREMVFQRANSTHGWTLRIPFAYTTSINLSE